MFSKIQYGDVHKKLYFSPYMYPSQLQGRIELEVNKTTYKH